MCCTMSRDDVYHILLLVSRLGIGYYRARATYNGHGAILKVFVEVLRVDDTLAQ